MAFETFVINIGGQEVTDLYPDVMSLEVEADDEMAAMARLLLAVSLEPDGSWTHLDDPRFSPWSTVEVSAGFDDGPDEVFSGYITHLRPYFDPDPARCTLEIWAMDGSVLMDREEKLKEWPDKKDSDIAAEIFSEYGFSARVDDTAVIHEEAMSTIIQRETDMQFLQRLAARNGFQCFVEDGAGHFRNPDLDQDPQPVLAAHFGTETTLNSFSLEVNALSPANVSMAQIDRTSKEVLEASVQGSEHAALGRTRGGGLPRPGMPPGQVFIGAGAATGSPEMTALCQGLFHQADWFVTGEGVVAANLYGRVLRPRRTVTIKGVGETYSGVYYVSHVTHSFTGEGYVQSFRVKRNALHATGTENFSEGGGLFS